MEKILNQVNPPLPKKKRVDSQGNNRVRFAVKTGTSTTIIAKGATENCFKAAWSRFVRDIEAGGGEVTVNIKSIR